MHRLERPTVLIVISGITTPIQDKVHVQRVPLVNTKTNEDGPVVRIVQVENTIQTRVRNIVQIALLVNTTVILVRLLVRLV